MAAPTRIAIIGAGTIGLSFIKLHLSHSTSPISITIFDSRPDLDTYIQSSLNMLYATATAQVKTTHSLLDAVADADIVQEQGPENLPFKKSIWPEIERHAPAHALFWSSTSGILASAQSADMVDKSRLVVVHPYNPPHVMPLLEVVPSPLTSEETVDRTLEYWRRLGRTPVVIKKECTGFVANRLAFALFREAVHLVNEGVVSAEEVDRVVETSMGPRWAVAGPFKSYTAGGGAGGLEAFFRNIGGTLQGCWDDAGKPQVGEAWEEEIFRQTREAYGVVDTGLRDRVTKRVLDVVIEEKEKH